MATNFSGLDLLGTSLTTPHSENQTGLPGYTGYVNPHGGSSFIGIKDDGTRDFITKEQAAMLGYVPSPLQTGDFYGGASGTISGA